MPKCSCNDNHCLHTNAGRTDPTRTKLIRNRFKRDFARRVQSIKRSVKEHVIDDDFFALQTRDEYAFLTDNALHGEMAGKSDDEKARWFMNWFNGLIMFQLYEANRTSAELESLMSLPWQEQYIKAAYQRGVTRSRSELIQAGIAPDEFGFGLRPEAQSAVRMQSDAHQEAYNSSLFRTKNETIGVGEATEQTVQRSVAGGLAVGLGAVAMSEMILHDIDKVLGNRSELIAETEVVRAHHNATMVEYRASDLRDVTFEVEWVTAGDEQVCELCESLEGQVMHIDDAQNLLPRHPRCRCVVIPVRT